MNIAGRIFVSEETATELFPCDDEGKNVKVSSRAVEIAKAVLGKEYMIWHTPNVFDVSYGSNYVASATVDNRKVLFLTNGGTFRGGNNE